MEVLLITGPAGVGKTTVAHALSRQLQARGVNHALIDSDELDHIFPVPFEVFRVTQESLSAVWEVMTRHGARRLILVGVYLDQEAERRWIGRAIGDAQFTCARLVASKATLRERIDRRELDAGAEDQWQRTLQQVESLASAPADPSVTTFITDDRSPSTIARVIGRSWPRDDPGAGSIHSDYEPTNNVDGK